MQTLLNIVDATTEHHKNYYETLRLNNENPNIDNLRELKDKASKEEDIFRQKQKDAVPDAPFSKTWHEQLLRRVLRYAHDNGYDGISWTPGKDHADRYDYSKYVDELHYDRRLGELRSVEKGSGIPKVLKDGVNDDNLTKHIEKGPATALKAAADTNPNGIGVITGKDLVVGGMGLKKFYDKDVPDYLDKYTKPFKAKVDTTKIPIHNAPFRVSKSSFNDDGSPRNTFRYIIQANSSSLDHKKIADSHLPFESEQEAHNIKDQLNGDWRHKTVQRLLFTPELHEHVGKPQHLYQKDDYKKQYILGISSIKYSYLSSKIEV